MNAKPSISILGLLLFFVPPAANAQLTCGGTVGPGGTFTMTADMVNCSASNALTVVGPAILDMAGHVISCDGGLRTGVRIQGSGASVRTGRVTNCFAGIDVSGEGKHLVRNLAAGSNVFAFGINSDANTLASNIAAPFGVMASAGFIVNGNRNKLVRNNSVGYPTGFTAAGDGNTFSRNTAGGTGLGTGFQSDNTTTGNKYKDNVVNGASLAGFDVRGARHVLKDNTVLEVSFGAGFLLQDGDGGHLIQGNAAVGAALGSGFGYRIEVDDNRIKDNRAQLNQFGLVVLSQNNTLTANHAIGNSTIDALDNDPDCDDNTWKKNLFGEAAPSCVQ